MTAGTQAPRLLPERDEPEDLTTHLSRFGPRPRVEARVMLQVLDDSGLRGRGGAAFPTGAKWRAVSEHGQGTGAVVVANAAECEPASFKDRVLIALSPHLILDGLELAAEAVGARRAIVYTTRSHDDVRRTLQTAISDRRRHSDCDVFIEVQSGPSRYIAGEETAIVSRLSGRVAKPRMVPPRPFQQGVGRLPTLVQNVETLAHAALIARFGADTFRSTGTDRSPGTSLVTVAGAVRRPRVLEVPSDTSVASIVAAAGGALAEPSAVLIGGYFGRWVAADAIWNLTVDGESLRSVGSSLGAGVVAVLPANACGVAETDRVLSYLAGESARQCGPCQVGLPAIAETFHRVATGLARPPALDLLARWSRDVLGRGACRHPDGAVLFLASALQVFGADLRHHLRSGACRFSERTPLLPVPEPEAGWW